MAVRKKNLLLCFDAFGTLFTPSVPVPKAYAVAARRHGIQCGDPESPETIAAVTAQFKKSFKRESERNPNYGKATGLGAEKWWGSVIRGTFDSFLKPDQPFPPALVGELLKRYSTNEGYHLYQDVGPFFEMLRDKKLKKLRGAHTSSWTWDKTVVGIITNSDDRVPGILESFGLKVGPRRIGTPDQRSKDAILQDDISFTVLSYDVGFEKPDRRVFDAATAMLKETLAGELEELTAEDFEKLYVGDDMEKDYEGADAAGWDGVLLRRESGEGDSIENEDTLKNVDTIRKNGGSTAVLTAQTLQALSRFRPRN